MQRRDFIKSGVLSTGLAACGAHAQAYPDRPITIILPFPAGNQNDALTRLISRHLETRLGQPVIVDYKTGATGAVGASYVSHAKPDGYTLLLSGMSSMVLAPSLLKKKLFDPLRDFAPVTRAGEFGLILVARNDLPANDLRSLIALAKERPGKLNYGSLGKGGTTHIVTEMFKQATGTEMVHVPYRTYPTAPLMAGEIDIFFDGVGSAKPFVEARKVKAFAVTGKQRSPLYPDVPCTEELGVPGLDLKVWSGFFAPANTPAPVIETLNQALVSILRNEADVRKYLLDNGYTIVADTSREFARQLQTDVAFAEKTAEKLGLVE